MALTEHLRQLSTLTVDSPNDGPLKQQAPRRLRRAFRQLSKRADGLSSSSPPTDFHQARIRAKRVRYAVEFFESVYRKPARRLITAATDLQDVLGEHQDGIVSTQHIHEAIHTVAATWPAETSLALGQVVQYEAQRGERLRRQFKPAHRDVKDAWRRLRRAF